MLAVTGGKGGVGKTTTALGVAAVLARDGRQPVVVDADLDVPDLARVADVAAGGLRRVADGEPVSAAPAVAGVTVLGATAAVEVADLRRALDRLGECSRPVVIDCPAGVGTPTGSRSVLRPRPCSSLDRRDRRSPTRSGPGRSLADSEHRPDRSQSPGLDASRLDSVRNDYRRWWRSLAPAGLPRGVASSRSTNR